MQNQQFHRWFTDCFCLSGYNGFYLPLQSCSLASKIINQNLQTMKKLILAVFSLCCISAASYSQTTAPAKKEDKMKTAAPADKKETAKATKMDKAAKPAKAHTAPATAPATTAVANTAATPTKKDGTPDKRYKANKTAKTAPTKKDGTPDMRYKENKAKPKS